jgi:beta-phosphoglucomutase-like phosphatase (HAD superfamily)
LFERIRADGTRIVLASLAKVDELETHKETADIEGLTNAETSSDDAEASKPEPDIFEAALAKLGDLTPDEVVVVGLHLVRPKLPQRLACARSASFV